MTGNFVELDYWSWARELDIVSTDHYLPSEDPANEIDLAFAADLARSLGGGRPWLLMEHSTSAVNWQPRNVAKSPGRLRRAAYRAALPGPGRLRRRTRRRLRRRPGPASLRSP